MTDQQMTDQQITDQQMTGTITAVCVTTGVQRRTTRSTSMSGINKGQVGRIVLTPTGVTADAVLDTLHHGGVDKAAYVYADEDAQWWAQLLQSEIPPGRFGENLRTSGIDVTGAVIGERWRLEGTDGHDVIVEVSEPRIPCSTFQHHMSLHHHVDRSGWVKRFTQGGRPGAYLRVLRRGEIAAPAGIHVLSRPDHGVTIGQWFADRDSADARALLAAESDDWQMGEALRSDVDQVVSSPLR